MSPEVALLTECEFCQCATACVPGPRNKQGRPSPPNGFELGYQVEQADYTFVTCQPCLLRVLQTAA